MYVANVADQKAEPELKLLGGLQAVLFNIHVCYPKYSFYSRDAASAVEWLEEGDWGLLMGDYEDNRLI